MSWAHLLKIKLFKSRPNSNKYLHVALPYDWMTIFLRNNSHQLHYTSKSDIVDKHLANHEGSVFPIWVIIISDHSSSSWGIGCFMEVASKPPTPTFLSIYSTYSCEEKKGETKRRNLEETIFPLLPILSPSRSSLLLSVERKIMESWQEEVGQSSWKEENEVGEKIWAKATTHQLCITLFFFFWLCYFSWCIQWYFLNLSWRNFVQIWDDNGS